MASSILGSAGGAIGNGLLGSTLCASLGRFAFSAIGSFIDNSLFSKNKDVNTDGSKISDVNFQHSDYGRMIPIIYGTIKISGNIIWASPLKELSKTTTQSMGGKGNKIRHSHTTYDYMISLAIAVCEGPINKITRIWADGRLLDRSLYEISVYNGDENQIPDETIESYMGVGKTTAYRGIAYIVLRNLHLAEFGNRIPEFSFEVTRELHSVMDVETPEAMISAVTIIPGAGEFVYDTVVQQKLEGDYVGERFIQKGFRKYINNHNIHNKANIIVALDDLQCSLPNVKWVAPVISWFATSENARDAFIVPGVEVQDSIITTPNEWRVASKDRSSAYCIGRNNGRPRYGGTPSDSSVINMLKELKARGLKIMLYPMMFIDVAHKPWRGRLTGTPEEIVKFFRNKDGYNNFILHYAALAKGMIDAFVIGSEMIGLTKVMGDNYSFPAVDELINLAIQVKSILGKDVKVTYAADWSEYHHTDGGWYNLDSLWACDAIDMVGIDAYFPLTEGDAYDNLIERAKKGWDSGECYDYYYEDYERTKKGKLSPEYAIKDITWWWNNKHYNPDGKETLWKPGSKKIWFTEYGFPSIHAATNQPNVFYNPESSESAFPRGSNGRVDFLSQRAGITATELRWRNSEIVENKFVWTWDARPYPEWPDYKDIWSDGGCWERGHWLQGKLGVSEIGQVIADLCKKSGLLISQYKIGDLSGAIVHGLMINRQNKTKDIIAWLRSAFGFDISEDGGIITFKNSEANEVIPISMDKLLNISKDKNYLVNYNSHITEIPTEVSIHYINKHRSYQVSNVTARRSGAQQRRKIRFDVPIVLEAEQARMMSENLLNAACLESRSYSFFLPMEYLFLSVGDVVCFNNLDLKINKIVFGKNKAIYIEAVRYSKSNSIIKRDMSKSEVYSGKHIVIVPETILQILDISLLPNEAQNTGRLLFAATGVSEGWQGASVFGDVNGEKKLISSITTPATIGNCITSLYKPIGNIIDRKSKIIVNLIQGVLSSATEEEFQSGKNLALIGNEIIQFQRAKLLQSNQYELSYLVRGKFGSQIENESEGHRFIMLNEAVQYVAIPDSLIGSEIEFSCISNGHSQDKASIYKINYDGVNLKPLSPVHICAVKDDGCLRIKWHRRSRASIPWRSGVDIPIAEESEKYIIELYSATRLLFSQESYKQSIDIYSAELNNSVDEIRVTQVSATLGRGFEGVLYL